jgi:Fe-S-cluster containining protein
VKNSPSPLRHPDIETIWIQAAGAIGWRVQRGDAAYASSDGRGNILIGVDEVLDSDDAVAQLIFHELCHGLIEGPTRWTMPDWGLSNSDTTHLENEHACLRIQVHLAEPYGLRELMAPTTEYRSYHDAIVGNPLAPETEAAACLAGDAANRLESKPWLEVLNRALSQTRAALDSFATAINATNVAAVHPVGFAFGASDESCSSCAWLYVGGRGRSVERCRQSADADGNGRRTEGRFRACERWEPHVDCHTCGACCREAYHSVTVSVRDPVVWKQADLVVRNGHRFEIRRRGDRCAALEENGSVSPNVRTDAVGPDNGVAARDKNGGRDQTRRFACSIYEDRPLACRDFEAGGRHCLVARRRVGLSS